MSISLFTCSDFRSRDAATKFSHSGASGCPRSSPFMHAGTVVWLQLKFEFRGQLFLLVSAEYSKVSAKLIWPKPKPEQK